MKPTKPKDFPLFPHDNGQWAKKVKGHLHYFGPWGAPQAALEKWLRGKDYILAGLTPPAEGIRTLGNVVQLWLDSENKRVDSGEVGAKHFADLKSACSILLRTLSRTRAATSLVPGDFADVRAAFFKRAPRTARKYVWAVRSMFRWALDEGLIGTLPRYGKSFKPPTQDQIRRADAKRPSKLFRASEIRKLLVGAHRNLKAMILLGINCGFGNEDCAQFPTWALDLEAGWHSFPRPKTGFPRRCPLWPETVTVLREVIANRKESSAEFVFVTQRGTSYAAKTVFDSPVGKEMARLQKRIGIHRPGRGFYGLRHTLATLGRKIDENATRAILGHTAKTSDMLGSVYDHNPLNTPELEDLPAEFSNDARLRHLTDLVHTWLFKPNGDSVAESAESAAS